MKRNNLKRIGSLFIIMILLLSTNVYANSSEEHQTKIIIEDGVENLPDYIIQQLLAENPTAGVITIYEYNYLPEIANQLTSEDLTQSDNMTINALGKPIVTNVRTTKSVTNRDRLAKDEFKFSVAKGETVTLSKTYSGTLKGSIKGTLWKKADIGADVTITAEYKRGTEYKGPEESSRFNSREFRMKFYEETGTYTQLADLVYHGTGLPYTEKNVKTTGTYAKPTRYLSYSIDRNI